MTTSLSQLSIWFLVYLVNVARPLNNGLARTPPMGWMSWGFYECGVDCLNNPNKCLDEALIMSVADIFYTEGYQEAGFEYIIIDDCWAENSRDSDGKLVPDRMRFPNGMKYLADYIHAKGLKFGMYTNVADTTCMGYPGSRGYFEIDAKTFAEWKVDYLKVDGCFVGEDYLNTAYIQLGKYLNATGRPMVYSCSWPYYIQFIINKKMVSTEFHTQFYVEYLPKNFIWSRLIPFASFVNLDVTPKIIRAAEAYLALDFQPNYDAVASHCNMWRNYHDVKLSWNAVRAIVYHYTKEYDRIAGYNGPGQWNDPDMLIFGTGSLSTGQARVQIAVYVMMSAPLLLSCDMKNIKDYEKELLLNMELLAIGQDALGIMAKPLRLLNSTITMWVKQRLPRKGDKYHSVSFALVNLYKSEEDVSFIPGTYGLNSTGEYTVMDVFSKTYVRNITLKDVLKVTVPAEDVILYTVFPL